MLFPELVAVKFEVSDDTTNLKEILWLKDLTHKIEDYGI